jgi:hypothetical protein
MNRRLVYGLALAVVVASVWLLVNQSPPAPPIEPAGRKLPPQTTLAQHARDVAAWEALSLAHPLFSPGRQPPSPPQVASGGPPPPEPLPRLTAVLVGPFGKTAMFIPNGSDQSVAVQEGGRMGPYRIRLIMPDAVLVEAPDGEHVLHPGFRPPVQSHPAPGQRAQSAGLRVVAARQ